jgi:hypothetical protein
MRSRAADREAAQPTAANGRYAHDLEAPYSGHPRSSAGAAYATSREDATRLFSHHRKVLLMEFARPRTCNLRFASPR